MKEFLKKFHLVKHITINPFYIWNQDHNLFTLTKIFVVSLISEACFASLTLRIMTIFKKEIATDPFTLYEVRWYYENCTVCISVRKYVMWTTCEITEFLIQRMVKMAIYNCYIFASLWIQGKPVERFIKKFLKDKSNILHWGRTSCMFDGIYGSRSFSLRKILLEILSCLFKLVNIFFNYPVYIVCILLNYFSFNIAARYETKNIKTHKKYKIIHKQP